MEKTEKKVEIPPEYLELYSKWELAKQYLGTKAQVIKRCGLREFEFTHLDNFNFECLSKSRIANIMQAFDRILERQLVDDDSPMSFTYYVGEDKEFTKEFLDGLQRRVQLCASQLGGAIHFAKFTGQLDKSVISFAMKGSWAQISASKISILDDAANGFLDGQPQDPFFVVRRSYSVNYAFMAQIRECIKIKDYNQRLKAFYWLSSQLVREQTVSFPFSDDDVIDDDEDSWG